MQYDTVFLTEKAIQVCISCKNDEECLKYICKEVKSSGKTSAYFKTSICLTLKKNYHIVFEGKIKGKISNLRKGKNFI